jgi:hypothetical protein
VRRTRAESSVTGGDGRWEERDASGARAGEDDVIHVHIYNVRATVREQPLERNLRIRSLAPLSSFRRPRWHASSCLPRACLHATRRRATAGAAMPAHSYVHARSRFPARLPRGAFSRLAVALRRFRHLPDLVPTRKTVARLASRASRP